MTTNFETLKANAESFYLGIQLPEGVEPMSDKAYDEACDEYEKESGHSIKDDLDWDKADRIYRDPVESLAKEKYNPEDILSNIKMTYKDREHYINYKYDGCAIEAQYSETGRLMRVLGTPDEEFGFIRTQKFEGVFPKQLPEELVGYKRIFGEALVDATEYGQLARNKANGLCNSKYLNDEIKQEILIRVYYCERYDGKKVTMEDLNNLYNNLPRLYRNDKNGNKVMMFGPAERLTPEQVSGEPIVTEKVGDDVHSVLLQVDGYVVYTNEDRFAYKMYYTDYADVIIKQINWEYRWDNGSFVPVLQFDPVSINDKNTQKCSSGGVKNLVNLKMGVGAIVRVVMSGGTIPKVIKVIKESEDYQYPVCECGTQLGYKDLVGSVLKCPTPTCKNKVMTAQVDLAPQCGMGVTWDDNGKPEFYGQKDLNKAFSEDGYFFIRLLKIDRFNPDKTFLEKEPIVIFSDLTDRYSNWRGTFPTWEQTEETLKAMSFSDENAKAGVEALKGYHDNQNDTNFDSCVRTLMSLAPNKKSDAAEAYDKDAKAFLANPTEEALKAILSKYFKMTGLQQRNAELNIPAVVAAIKTL